ncbi:MAG: hypothetical protein AAFP80_02215 [Pseudomonadota bacterium]
MIIRPLMANVNDLQVPFRHQSPSMENDMHGAPQTSWLERGIAWGAYERSGVTTNIRAQADEPDRSGHILVRRRMANPCQVGDRLVGDVTWYVNAVADPDGTQRFQRLYCTTRSDEAGT